MSFKEFFKGKRVLVTGAGRGIGKALVAKFYEYEAIIFAVSRNPQILEDLKKEFPKITISAVNLEDWDATKTAIEAIGHVHFLVNNAGFAVYEEFLTVSPENFEKIFNTNFKAVINVSQIVAKEMIRAGNGGSIVNVSSVAAKKGMPGMSMYCSSKAALDMLTRVMAMELGSHQIRVNSVNPGAIDTDMYTDLSVQINNKMLPLGTDIEAMMKSRIPLGRVMIEMREIVNLTMFVLSDLAPMIHGGSIMLDGGFTAT